MTTTVRHVLATLTAPVAFATRRRTARQLFAFALAEEESMLELRAAAARTEDPERRALYLRHALDESRHAITFARHAAEIRLASGLSSLGHPRTGCEELHARLGEVGFLAFVHLGERRGRTQFEAYERHFARRGDAKLRALFTALLGDEREHERYTRAQLVACAGDERAARRALRRAAAWEALRAWRRSGRALAQGFYQLSMLVLYACLAPFAVLLRVARPARGGWR